MIARPTAQSNHFLFRRELRLTRECRSISVPMPVCRRRRKPTRRPDPARPNAHIEPASRLADTALAGGPRITRGNPGNFRLFSDTRRRRLCGGRCYETGRTPWGRARCGGVDPPAAPGLRSAVAQSIATVTPECAAQPFLRLPARLFPVPSRGPRGVDLIEINTLPSGPWNGDQRICLWSGDARAATATLDSVSRTRCCVTPPYALLAMFGMRPISGPTHKGYLLQRHPALDEALTFRPGSLAAS